MHALDGASRLSKTDFIHFLHCPKSLWLLKHRPQDYPQVETSEFAKKLADDGYKVEEQVKAWAAARDDADRYSFQSQFQTSDGFYARADMVRQNADGTITLYEIKSATSIKDGGAHDHLKDACFQLVTAEHLGHQVAKVVIVHLNGDYQRAGDIDPEALLSFTDVTQDLRAMRDEIESAMYAAAKLLAAPKIDETFCTCLTLSKSNHCASFAHFNPSVPSPSIYHLPRISKTKLQAFAAEQRFDLDDIGLDEVTTKQKPVLQSAHQKTPVIDRKKLANWFSLAEYPLYFLDYEAFSSAIPIINGARPHGAIPFQYSLHIKSTPDDETLQHVEYLADEAALPDQMIQHMSQHIGPTGSIISWHASYENTQNRTMAAQFPEHSAFLLGLIDRTLDLETLFTDAYVDIAFGGSTSIKKVLPVLAGDLDYNNMAIGNGTQAMLKWEVMINLPQGDQKRKIRADLLDYCKLDTYAMVRIFEEMERV